MGRRWGQMGRGAEAGTAGRMPSGQRTDEPWGPAQQNPNSMCSRVLGERGQDQEAPYHVMFWETVGQKPGQRPWGWGKGPSMNQHEGLLGAGTVWYSGCRGDPAPGKG